MPPEVCEQHQEIATNIAVMKNDIAYIRNKICSHVEEGEKTGGFRDRLLLLEQEVSAIKKGQWIRAMVAGIIGGLIANGTPEVLAWIIKAIVK